MLGQLSLDHSHLCNAPNVTWVRHVLKLWNFVEVWNLSMCLKDCAWVLFCFFGWGLRWQTEFWKRKDFCNFFHFLLALRGKGLANAFQMKSKVFRFSLDNSQLRLYYDWICWIDWKDLDRIDNTDVPHVFHVNTIFNASKCLNRIC